MNTLFLCFALLIFLVVFRQVQCNASCPGRLVQVTCASLRCCKCICKACLWHLGKRQTGARSCSSLLMPLRALLPGRLRWLSSVGVCSWGEVGRELELAVKLDPNPFFPGNAKQPQVVWLCSKLFHRNLWLVLSSYIGAAERYLRYGENLPFSLDKCGNSPELVLVSLFPLASLFQCKFGLLC